MPYLTAAHRMSAPQPVPRPELPRPRAVLVPGSAGVTPPTAVLPPGWNFTARVWLSFDGPAVSYPAWIEVTGWVQMEQGISIAGGRQDGLSDINAATCTLIVDNNDGRWTPTNPGGAWFGQIRKGCWLRVDLVPLSGVTSTRYTGFITGLPTGWKGQTSTATITASDRFVLLAQQRKLYGMIAGETLRADPAAAYVAGYWPLQEPAGATYVSDVSGQAAQAQQALAVRDFGVKPGTGLTFGNTQGPGFDGVQVVQFAPSGTPMPAAGGGTTGALPLGSYLSGTVASGGACWQISWWMKTTTLDQPIWSYADPTSCYAMGAGIDAQGFLNVWQNSLSGSAATAGIRNASASLGTASAADGVWHQFMMNVQVSASGVLFTWTMDGWTSSISVPGASVSTTLYPPPTISRLTVGGAEGWNGDTSVNALCLYTGALADVALHVFPTAQSSPLRSSAIAGLTGWAGETAGNRVARIAAYAGLNPPGSLLTNEQWFIQPAPVPGSSSTATGYVPGPTTNLTATAHPVGTQQLGGRTALDAIREAARTENMPVYVDRLGRLTLAPVTARANPTAAVTIDARDLDPGVGFPDDFQYVHNVTDVTPNGQSAITVYTNGTASVARYGEYSASVASASLGVAEATSLGAAVNALGADPPPRMSPLVCEVGTLAGQAGYGAAWYDAVLALDINSCIQVINLPSQAPASTQTVYVEGYTEAITAANHTLSWSTTGVTGNAFQLDSSTLDTPTVALTY